MIGYLGDTLGDAGSVMDDDYTVVDALVFLGEMTLFCLVCFAVFCFPVIMCLAPREVL